MLQLTRLNGPGFALNPDLIERADATPDTVVTLVNGNKYVIRETLDELVELVRRYRADVVSAARHEQATGSAPGAHRPTRARAVSRIGELAECATVVPLRDEQGGE